MFKISPDLGVWGSTGPMPGILLSHESLLSLLSSGATLISHMRQPIYTDLWHSQLRGTDLMDFNGTTLDRILCFGFLPSPGHVADSRKWLRGSIIAHT